MAPFEYHIQLLDAAKLCFLHTQCLQLLEFVKAVEHILCVVTVEQTQLDLLESQ